jgi:hypothetical protein
MVRELKVAPHLARGVERVVAVPNELGLLREQPPAVVLAAAEREAQDEVRHAIKQPARGGAFLRLHGVAVGLRVTKTCVALEEAGQAELRAG